MPRPKNIISIEQLLFSQGFGTRKRCRVLVIEGLVQINGETVNDSSLTIDVSDESAWPLTFSVNGEAWEYHAKAYLMLNKPAGYECSQKAKSHPSVYTLLPSPLRLRDVQSVGRLDQDTTGLLLFSDDGQFIHQMASPKHHVPKVYEITTSSPISDQQIRRLLDGVVLDDSPTPVRALACERPAPSHLKMTLAQGKYHQVKRMLSAVDNHVAALHRSQIGNLVLPSNLGTGEWRFLTVTELLAASSRQ
ncbi:MAG: pseudouridine synthase [Betaproteobacteria bacterium]|jgi:16S rRNA pseudouridine516 synthase